MLKKKVKHRQKHHKCHRQLRKRSARFQRIRSHDERVTSTIRKKGRAFGFENDFPSQGAPIAVVKKKNKAVKQSGTVDNPIVIDSSTDGLMSLESPVGNLELNAFSVPSCSTLNWRQKVAQPTKTRNRPLHEFRRKQRSSIRFQRKSKETKQSFRYFVN